MDLVIDWMENGMIGEASTPGLRGIFLRKIPTEISLKIFVISRIVLEDISLDCESV